MLGLEVAFLSENRRRASRKWEPAEEKKEMIKAQVEARLNEIDGWLKQDLLTAEDAAILRDFAQRSSVDRFSGTRWMSGGRSGVTIEISFGRPTDEEYRKNH